MSARRGSQPWWFSTRARLADALIPSPCLEPAQTARTLPPTNTDTRQQPVLPTSQHPVPRQIPAARSPASAISSHPQRPPSSPRPSASCRCLDPPNPLSVPPARLPPSPLPRPSLAPRPGQPTSPRPPAPPLATPSRAPPPADPQRRSLLARLRPGSCLSPPSRAFARPLHLSPPPRPGRLAEPPPRPLPPLLPTNPPSRLDRKHGLRSVHP